MVYVAVQYYCSASVGYPVDHDIPINVHCVTRPHVQTLCRAMKEDRKSDGYDTGILHAAFKTVSGL